MVRKQEEITRLEYLGQKWSSKKPIIKDYACNVNADKLVALDVILKKMPKDSKERKILENVREILLIQGEALYIRSSDPFTNLCIKVGSTIRKVKF